MLHDGPLLIEKNNIRIIHCHSCGFAHQNPFAIQDIDAYYKNDNFYNEHSPVDWFEKTRKEHERGLWNAQYASQVKLMQTGAARSLFKNRLIDWGAGEGYFLDYWRKNAGIGLGIEPSQKAKSYAPNPETRRFLISESDDIPSSFASSDYARAALVLEHLENPLEFVRKMVSYLRPLGRVLIIVPNDFSPLQERIGGHGFISNVHTNYFTPSGLRALLKRCKLNVIHETATFPMELFITSGLDYRGNDELGRRLHITRLRFEKYYSNFDNLYHKLYTKYQWGRELIFLAEKRA